MSYNIGYRQASRSIENSGGGGVGLKQKRWQKQNKKGFDW